MLAKIWLQHRNQFRSLVSRILFDKSSIDDVIQEAFTRALQNGKTFDDEVEAYKYMRKVVVNTTIDYYRHCRRHSARFQNQDFTAANNPAVIEQDSNHPFQLLAKKEEAHNQQHIMDQVREALNELSPAHQEAIKLVFHKPQDKTLKEVCRKEGIPYSTLRSRTLAAIDRIRERLKDKKGTFGEIEVREEVR